MKKHPRTRANGLLQIRLAIAECLESRRLLSETFVGPAQSMGELAHPSSVAAVGSTGRQPAGALSGKIVFASAGHGLTANAAGEFSTQRGETNEMVEDFGNQDQMTMFVDYAFNAGATVVPMRPVGYQPNEVVLDNDSAGVTYTGAWSNSSSTIFYGSAGDVPYRYSSIAATETATARYTPSITVAGFYPVYTWAKNDTDRATDQTYHVVHSGGTSEVKINHRRVGKGWIYLGTYYLNTGSSAYVEISNKSASSGIVIADAIRFGNGMGDIDRGDGVSGATRSDEASLYWIEAQKGQGVADSVFRGGIDTDVNDNVGAPPKWAAWMNNEAEGAFTDRLFLSYHSNATGGAATSRGTVGLYNGNNDIDTKTPHQFEWASLIGNEVNDDMVALGSAVEFPWVNDNTPTLDRSDIEFGEINNLSIGDEFDATIIEVAYHDNVEDAADMRDPEVRNWVARASEQAMVRYFNTYAGTALNMLPDPATNVRATVDAAGDVTISWTPPVVSSFGGDAPTGYVVYTSPNGYAFGNPQIVAGGATTSFKFLKANIGTGINYFRVAATNAGGESTPSEVVGARSNSAASPILIVNGFDRIDKSTNYRQTISISGGAPVTIDRVRPRYQNSFDYVAQVGAAIGAYSTSLGFDSVQNESVINGQVNLANYAAVIWLSGEESTADDTFNSTEQTLVTNYLNGGGKFFVSGAEIGWDLDSQGGGATFYNSALKSDYVQDDAGTYNVTGAAGSIFAGLSLSFDNGSLFYDAEFPDVIAATGGSTVAMNYSGGAGGAAAVQYTNGANNSKVVSFGFPFETITTAANRNSVMAAVLGYFNINSVPTVGSLSGKVYVDVDSSGTRGGSEPGLNGWTVFLDTDNSGAQNGTEPITTTSGAGDFSFSNLTAGPYNVRVVLQSGFIRTSPSNGLLVTSVVNGSNTGNVDFGNFPTTFNGGVANDTYTLKLDPANALRVQIIESIGGGAATTYSILKASITSLTFSPGAGDDSLDVQYTTGSPIPSSGITFTGGTHTAGDALIVTGSSGIDNITSNATSVTFGGTINYSQAESLTVNTLAGNDTLTQAANPGAPLVFNGGTNSDTLNINGGTYTFNADANVGTASLTVNVNNTSATFNTTQHLNQLNVTNGVATLATNGSRVIVTNSVSFVGTGKIDLKDNDLIIKSMARATVEGFVKSGFGNFNWLGTGITSSTAATFAQTDGSRSLGVILNSDWGYGTFDGQSVIGTDVLVKFTWTGDANIDGLVDNDDFGQFLFGFNGGGTKIWINGDFDFNTLVDNDDFGWFLTGMNAFNASGHTQL